MFLATKLFELFMLPPALVGEALIVGLVLLASRKARRIGYWLVGLAASCYYLLSLWPIATMLLYPLERGVRPLSAEELKRAQLIVVLAGGVSEAASPEYEPELYGDSWVRLARGMLVFDQLQRQVPLLYTGALRDPFVSGAQSSEGVLVKRAAVRWGLPADRFWVEDGSRDTYESAVATRQLLDARSGRAARYTIVLVTSAWHIRRAEAVFRKVGFDVLPVGCDYRVVRRSLTMTNVVPSVSAFSTSNSALREWIGLLGYRLRGRL